MNLRNPIELETFLRARISEKTESDRLDYKATLDLDSKEQKLKLLLDLNSIVNATSEEFEGHGFLLFGMNREDGKITHEVKLFRDLAVDNIENSIVQLADEYMAPQLGFNLFTFKDADVGHWGCIVIWPAAERPVIFKKQGSYKDGAARDTSKRTQHLWSEGDWFVRRGPRNTKPNLDDHRRIQEQQLGPLRLALRDVQHQLGHQQTLIDQLMVDRSIEGLSGAQMIRRAYQQPERLMVRGVRQEVENFIRRFPGTEIRDLTVELERFELLNEIPNQQQRGLITRALNHAEESTRPLVELLGAANSEVHLDLISGATNEALSQVRLELLNAVMGRGPHLDSMQVHGSLYNALLAYPAILLFGAAATLSLNSLNDIQRDLFFAMMPFEWRAARIQPGQEERLNFSDHWNYLVQLDVLHHLMGSHSVSPTLDRMQDLFQRPDWLGLSLRYSDRKQLLIQGQMLASLGYVISKLQRNQEVGHVPASWMNYFGAGVNFKKLLWTLKYMDIVGLVGKESALWSDALTVIEEQSRGQIHPLALWNEISSQE